MTDLQLAILAAAARAATEHESFSVHQERGEWIIGPGLPGARAWFLVTPEGRIDGRSGHARLCLGRVEAGRVLLDDVATAWLQGGQRA